MEAITNAKKQAGLRIPNTPFFYELDLYLPALKLGFEYQVSFPPALKASSNIPYLYKNAIILNILLFF